MVNYAFFFGPPNPIFMERVLWRACIFVCSTIFHVQGKGLNTLDTILTKRERIFLNTPHKNWMVYENVSTVPRLLTATVATWKSRARGLGTWAKEPFVTCAIGGTSTGVIPVYAKAPKYISYWKREVVQLDSWIRPCFHKIEQNFFFLSTVGSYPR